MKSIKTKKKIALGTLSTAAIVAIPVATVISCGELSKLATKIKSAKRNKNIDLKTDTVSYSRGTIETVVASILTNRSNYGFERLGTLDQRKFKHSMRLDEIAKLRADESNRLANTTQDQKISFDITKWATEYEKYFLESMNESVAIQSITFQWSDHMPYKFEVEEGSSLSETLDELKNARLSFIEKMESSEYKSYLKKYKRAQLKRDNLELWKLDNETYSELFEKMDDINIKIYKLSSEAEKEIETIIRNDWRYRRY